jgi:hypothetical protein
MKGSLEMKKKLKMQFCCLESSRRRTVLSEKFAGGESDLAGSELEAVLAHFFILFLQYKKKVCSK